MMNGLNKNDMKTEWVTQPFDIDTAKKIQNGEIEGRIKTRNGVKARIVCWDYKSASQDYPILALITTDSQEVPIPYSINGKYNIYGYEVENGQDLVIQIPEYQTLKCGDIAVFIWENKNEEERWIVLIKSVEIAQSKTIIRAYAALCLKHNGENGFPMGIDVFMCNPKRVRIPTEEEIRVLIDALETSKIPRAKECCQRFFSVENSPKLSNSEKIGENLHLKDDLENKAAKDYMDGDIISGPRGSFRKGFCSGWETALRFARDLIKNSHSLPAEYGKLVDEHFDELI